ncbi:MAG: ABC transporter substrate-binding protein [Rhodospirillaceae bacterium]|nr:ABC transporter substrate-binding protein [Rhodospirillaceae bacterium]
MKKFVALLALTALPLLANADSGVYDDRIVFGQSAVFSGPNRLLGMQYQAGLLAAFAERNAAGGVDGRALEMISLDDGYEPDRAAANAERFVSENDVFAVIGTVGTPTSRRIAPILRTAEIPLVGPFTGTDFLRDAQRFPYVVNLRTGYLQEVEVLVDEMVERGVARFGVIYQDDAFGRTVLANYKTVLDRYEIPILAKASYTRNSHAVHSALFSLEKADLEAILIVGSYAAGAEIMNLSHSLGHTYVMASLSFAPSHELASELVEFSERIIMTEVVPSVGNPNLEVVRNFLGAMAAMSDDVTDGHAPDETALEGYILGHFVISVLERMEGEWTRDSFMASALSPEPVRVDDWELVFEPGSNTGTDFIRLINFGDYDSIRE